MLRSTLIKASSLLFCLLFATSAQACDVEANININGNSNQVDIVQAGDAHCLELGIVGNSNVVDIEQATTVSAQHYLETTITGSNNVLDVIQNDSSKTAFIKIDGDYNTGMVVQKGSGQHYLDLTLNGDSHDATVVQEGGGNHNATVELTNGGGAWTFSLNQSGNNSQTYSLPHGMSDGSTTSGTCYVPAGCSLTVIQNN